MGAVAISPQKKNNNNLNMKLYTRARGRPICPYNSKYNGTQYNVIVNGVLFEVLNPPETYDQLKEDEETQS